MAQRYANEGWVRRRLRRAVSVSTSTLALIVASTACISASVAVVLLGNFSAGFRGASVEQLVLKRMLADTSPEQLARACSRITRIGAGASSERGWNVCLDSPLGKRWLQAGKTTDGGDARWKTQGAGLGSAGDSWVGRTPVYCRAVSIGMGMTPAYAHAHSSQASTHIHAPSPLPTRAALALSRYPHATVSRGPGMVTRSAPGPPLPYVGSRRARTARRLRVFARTRGPRTF